MHDKTITAAPRAIATLVLVLVVLFGAGAPARAADIVVTPGMELTLTQDLTLGDDDSFTAGDFVGARCKIHGGGHKIVTPVGKTWTGKFKMVNCDVDGLGVPRDTAIATDGGSDVTIVGSVFTKSSEISISVGPAMSVTSVSFIGNRIEKDSIIELVPESLDRSQDAFTTKGPSMGRKVFQGNVVRRGRIVFRGTDDWLIGGLAPGEGNVLAGDRTGIFIDGAGGMTIQGNYSSTLGRGWNQVKNLNVFAPEGQNLIVEHNVFIGMAWNTEVNSGGELRYNLFANPIERAWVQAWTSGGPKVHHNVLVQTKESQADMMAGGFTVFPGNNTDKAGPPTMEIYNNTLDAGGTCNPGIGHAVGTGGVLASLRSNAFVNIRLPAWTGTALVGTEDKVVPDPLMPMLGYADYNFFHSPDGSVLANYNVGVMDKSPGDPGFGAHDLPAGGTPNPAVEPKFAGPIPHSFPFDDEMVAMGAVSVCQILAFYRQAYMPADGSPLIDAGDPMEGAGNDIGAIGAGDANDVDKFGTLPCPGTQPLVADPGIFKCPAISIGGNLGGELPPPGITCVCDASAGAPGGALSGALGLAGLVGYALLMRRRRRA